ncbi:MAG: ribosome-associated translation inhibitor RaiA [Chitinophagaceae bacterium]|nr:ribosome-associated translation inhibitor RaiA [Chitinophagaceae bacterium]
MKINIQSPGFKVNPQLNLFIQEKAEKLFNYYSDLISIEISLKISNSDTKENKVCEIRLVIPGNDILASSQCKTFEEAVLSVVEIIKNRIKRKKSKIIGTRNDISPKELHN